MFVVLLKFSSNRQAATGLLKDHLAWIQRGIDDGVFLLSGSLKPNMGGVILAQGIGAEDLAYLVEADPFVAEDVVTVEILEIAPAKADPRLAFLLPQ